MSAAAPSFTHFNGYQLVPPTNGVFPLADKSLTHEPGQAQASFLDTIVGRHGGLRAVLSQVAIVAPTNATVLICGETGTGKELIARAIHELSPRHNRNLVKLNCAAIPAGLLESELFGHERGAFTGALMQKKGRFELADGGSLFLDEIGDISLELQPKLLRAVQEQEFERLGSTRTIRVRCADDCRDSSRSSSHDSRRKISGGSVLPTQCVSDCDPATSRTARGYSAAGELFCVELSRRDGKAD